MRGKKAEKEKGLEKERKSKKDKPRFDLSTEVGRLKLEIAGELGLKDKIEKNGWKSLTSKESGAVGGKLSGKLRQNKEKDE